MFPKIIKISIIAVLFFGVYHYSFASFTISRPSTNNFGLVGYWTFDGKNVVNGVALDSSGNGNNGNLINIASSTFYAAGKIGQGFNFDGTNDYVSVPDSNDWAFGTGDFSINLWAKFNTLPSNNDDFVSQQTVAVGEWRFYRDGVTNQLNFIKNGGGTISLTIPWVPSTNTWYHLAVTRSGNDFIMYIDGQKQTSLTDTDSMSDFNGPLVVGGYAPASLEVFDGWIDDVRIYNRALSANEVKALYNQGVSKLNKTPTNILTNGLVGHWTMDGKNVVNGVAMDSTANANNGNLINIASSTFYAAGKIGQGFDFDGVNDYVNMGNNASLAPSSAITISAWINSLNPLGTNHQRIVDKETNPSSSGSYVCGLQTSGKIRFLVNTGVVITRDGFTVLNANNWYHVVCVWDGTNMYVYLNGASNAPSTAQTGTMADNGADLNIGRRGVGNNFYFNGKIDDVRLYNRALSAGEIKNLYNQGVSKLNKTPTNILTNGLVGHWTMDGKNVVNGVAMDSTANANNGNLINIASSTFYAAGKIGQGFNFDGVNDYVSVPYNASLKLGNTGSVSLWVKPSVTSPSQTRNLISYGGTSYNNGYLLSQYDTSLRVYWMNGTQAFDVNNAFTANKWSHITLTNDNGALTAYVNGVQSGSGTSSGTIVNNYSTFIGGISTGWIENGNIDDVRVYNRALSAGEIKMLYNMGR